MVRALFFALIFLTPAYYSAQDVHFTQWEASEMNFNPAQSGNFDGDWQLSSIYRNQWKSIARPFTTFSSSFASKLHFLPAGWSVSGMVLSDRAGSVIQMKNDQIHLGVSKQIKLLEHRISLGIQGSYTKRGLDWTQVSNPDQYNQESGLFDTALPTSENLQNTQLNYPDIHSGLVWNLKRNRSSYEAGIGLFHLLRPTDSYFGKDAYIPVRYSSHVAYKLKYNERRYLSVEIRDTRHAQASATLLGLSYGILWPNEKSSIKEIFSTIMNRNGIQRNVDAIMLGAGFATRRVQFMLAYDFNISSLSAATANKGGIELGFIFTSPSSINQETTIPCDRY